MSDPENNEVNDCEGLVKSPESVGLANRRLATFSAWQAPVGVAPGTWDYVNRDHIGDQYDSFVDGEPLTEVDRKIISRYLPAVEAKREQTGVTLPDSAPVVIDFGSGTGRTLLPIVRDGYRGMAVDLSESMLRNLGKKLSSGGQKNVSVTSIQANLVELGCIADGAASHGVCMLSTLGMIKGSANRGKFLRHVKRIVRPGGLFFVHAHNYFYQWRHPGGVRWAATNGWEAVRGREEIGDRLATYRRVSGMFIHQFRRSELGNVLKGAGLSSLHWYGIEAGSTEPVPINGWQNPFRFVGWVVVGTS